MVQIQHARILHMKRGENDVIYNKNIFIRGAQGQAVVTETSLYKGVVYYSTLGQRLHQAVNRNGVQ